MTTVLRFRYSDTNTDFYENEVPTLIHKHIQDVDLCKYVTGTWKITKTGNPYSIGEMRFNLFYSGTIDKIDTLFDYVDDYEQPATMIMYYRYGIDTTTYPLYVQMMREDYKIMYAMGQKAAHEILPIRFVETIPIDEAAVLRKRIGI